MRKQFLGNLILLLVLNFLIKPLWLFGIDRNVQNAVGEEAYGRYFALVGFTIIFNIVLDLGLTHYNNQSIAKNQIRLKRNLSRLLGLKFFLGIIYLAVALIVGLALGYHEESFSLLTILAVNQFLASLLLFMRSNISGLQLFRTDALLSIADKLLMIVLCAFLLYTPILGRSIQIMDFAWAQLLSYAAVNVIAFFAVRHQIGGKLRFEFKFAEHRRNLYRSFPYALLILLMALYTRVDGVMLDLLEGPYYSGVYAEAFRLVDAVNQIGYLFAILLLPLFAKYLSVKIDVSPLVELTFNLLLAGTTAISLACYFYAEPLMDLLYVGSSDLSTPVLQWLILSTLAFATTFVFGTLLTAGGELSTLNKVAFSGFALNILLNFILIPQHQALGAAYATIATQFATAFVQLLICLRKYKIHFSVSAYWLRVVLYLGGSVFLAILIASIEGLEWQTQFLLTAVVILFFSAVVGFFKWREAIELFASRLN